MSDNTPEDLVFRLAAVMVGTVPATVNWQADNTERIVGKVQASAAKLLLVDAATRDSCAAAVRAIGEQCPSLVVYCTDALHAATERLEPSDYCAALQPSATRIIIFSSGTTGTPKGVCLPYSAYKCSQGTFDAFIGKRPRPPPNTHRLPTLPCRTRRRARAEHAAGERADQPAAPHQLDGARRLGDAPAGHAPAPDAALHHRILDAAGCAAAREHSRARRTSHVRSTFPPPVQCFSRRRRRCRAGGAAQLERR